MLKKALWFLLLLAACPLLAAQTITINPTTTYQTWRAYGGNCCNKTAPDWTNCPSVQDAPWQQAMNFMASELGVNYARIELGWDDLHTPPVNLEGSGNDNSDPFTFSDPTNLTPFSTYLTTLLSGAGGCRSSVATWISTAGTFRTVVANAGITPETELTFFNYINKSFMEPWWKDGSGGTQGTPSNGCGVDEASEGFHAVLLWAQRNYGYYPEFVTFNEPDNVGSPQSSDTTTLFGPETYAGSGSCSTHASWYGGWVNSFYTRIQNDSTFPINAKPKISGPTPASGGATLTDLDAINLVSGAESHLGRISYHGYPLPSDFGAAIWNRARTDSPQHETEMDEICCKGFTDSSYATGFGKLTLYILPTIINGHISKWAEDGSWGIGNCPAGSGESSPGAHDGCLAGSTQPSGIGLDFDPDLSTFYVQPQAYVLRQFFHYVKPGYRMVLASGSTGLGGTTAWLRPDGGLNIIVPNNGSAQSVSLSGLPNVAFNVYRLDPTMCSGTGQFRCTPAAPVVMTPSGGNLSLGTMSSDAVWTLEQATSVTTDFLLSATPTSTSVTAGQTATFTLSITPAGGLNQSVSINCSGAPPSATCTVTPNPVTLSGSSSATATVTVATSPRPTAASWSAPNAPPSFLKPILPWLLWLLAVATWAAVAISHHGVRNVRPSILYLGVLLLLVSGAVTIVGCGGGGAGSGSGGTPAGSYRITITGTSGSLSHTTNVTLQVN